MWFLKPMIQLLRLRFHTTLIRVLSPLMEQRLTLYNKGILMIALPIIVQLVCFIMLADMQRQADRAAKIEYYARGMFNETNWYVATLLANNLAALEYFLHRDPDVLKYATKSKELALAQPDALKRLFAEDPAILSAVNQFEKSSHTILANGDTILDTAKTTVNQGTSGLPDYNLKSPWLEAAKARKRLLELGKQKFDLSPSGFSRQRELLSNLLLAGLVANLFFFFLLIYLYGKNITGRLAILNDNAMRLSKDQPLNKLVTGSDEIAQLDMTFHQMADALKLAYEKDRSILSNMPVSLIEISDSEDIESMNPRAITTFRSDSLVGKKFSKLVPELQYSKFSALVDKSLGKIYETEAMRSNGLSFPIQITFSKFQSSSGQKYLASITDMAEKQELERLKRAFIATITHELRTPLTSIHGALALIDATATGDKENEVGKLVTNAKRNTDRLLRLVNDILDVEKLESGQLALLKGSVSVERLIDSSIDSVQQFARDRQVKIESDSSDAIVEADEDRIIQVLINLLSNAVKFSQPDSVVTVKTNVSGQKCEIRVIDTGKGIPAESKNLIFEKFQQAHNQSGKRNEGTGLGLAICRQIITLHGGDIGFTSDEGKGTTFWFTLALAKKP